MKLSALDEYRTEQFTHHNATIQSRILEHFRSCRQHNRFIDLEVEVEKVIFPCHRILLDSFCPYFAGYFSFHEVSSNKGMSAVSGGGEVERLVLTYEGVTVAGFARLLDYMYTSELEVTADDVIDVLRCADFLQFHHVVHLCSGFMQQHITVETCLQVLALAQAHDLHDLSQQATHFIQVNLEQIIAREEFGQLSLENLVKIIESNYLDLSSEIVVVQAVITWVKANQMQRKSFLPNLLRHARLQPIDIEQLKLIFQAENPGLILKEDEKTLWDLVLREVSVSKMPDRLTEVMVVISRETERKHRGVVRNWSSVYFYDPESLRWEKLTSLPFDNRQYYAVSVLNNILYITGGQNIDACNIDCTKIVFNENWSYDPLGNSWEEKQPMFIPRYNHSTTSSQGKLYVVGGRASSSSTSLRGDGEVYDPIINQWTTIATVRCINGIGNAALASLDGKLYLCGGTYTSLDRQNSTSLETYTGAQVYNPSKDLWQELLSLEREINQKHIRVISGDVLSVEGFLLLLDDEKGKSHYLYNPVTHSVSSLVQAHGHHRFASWVVYQGHLVCCGGVEDGQFGMTDMVHSWNMNQRHQGWSMMTPLPHPMSHHACVTMYRYIPKNNATEMHL